MQKQNFTIFVAIGKKNNTGGLLELIDILGPCLVSNLIKLILMK